MASDIKCATTQFDWPLAAGSFDVTIPDLGYTPKAIKITILGSQTNGTPEDDATLGFGYATATDQRSCSAIAIDGVVDNTSTWRTQTTTHVARYYEDAVNTDVGQKRLLSVAPISNGWRLNAADVSTRVMKCKIEFYGGDDLQVAVGSWVPSSLPGPSTKLGIGFQPNYLDVSGIGYSTATGVFNQGIIANGVAYDNGVDIEQASIMMCPGRYGVDLDEAGLLLSDDSVTGQQLWSGTTWKRHITGFIADGWESDGTGTAGGDVVYYLAMNIGTTKAAVQVVDSPSSTGADWSVTGIGFKPQGVSIGATILDATDALGPVYTSRAGFVGFGSADAVRAASVSINVKDNADTSSTSSISALKSMYMVNDVDAVVYDVGQPIFNDDGWTVPAAEINNVASTARKWMIVAIEAEDEPAPSEGQGAGRAIGIQIGIGI